MKSIGTSKKKTDKPFLAARIPTSLNSALEAHVESTGESKTDTIINALAAYLGWSDNETISTTSASDRLSVLEQRVDALENLLREPKQTSLFETNINFDKRFDNRQPTKKQAEPTATTTPKETKETKEWLTAQEAFNEYKSQGGERSWESFRKFSPERLRELGFAVDKSRKGKDKPSRWIKRA